MSFVNQKVSNALYALKYAEAGTTAEAEAIANLRAALEERYSQPEDEAERASMIADMVNVIGLDTQRLAEDLACQHRTLQQNFMRVCMAFCSVLARAEGEGLYDARNEASCRLARTIVIAVGEKPYLPCI